MAIFKYWKKSLQQKGFSLLEVLASIGILGSVVLIVAYMNVSNLNEVFRHNTEMYADLIAQEQFSGLFALRNQYAFDKNEQTKWENIYNLTNNFYLDLRDSNWEIKNGEKREGKSISNSGGLNFSYSMKIEKIKKEDAPEDAPDEDEDEIIKAHLEVKWKGKGNQDLKKDYYTLIGKYLW